MKSQTAESHGRRAAQAADHDSLLAVVDRLRGMGDLSGEQRHALAEANFRLAVSPGTMPGEARARMEEALALDPLHPKLHYHMGLHRHRSGDLYGAVCSYRRALRLVPGSKRTLTHMALALGAMQGKPKRLGRDLLDALWAGTGVDAVLTKVESWIRTQSAGEERDEEEQGCGEKQEKIPEEARRPSPVESGPLHAVTARWHGLSRVYLLDLLCRTKASDSQIQSCMESFDKGSGEEAPDERRLFSLLPALASGKRADNGAGAAGAVGEMTGTLQALAQEGDGGRFVEMAATAALAGKAPDEWICVLHYQKFGPEKTLSCKEALELLERYPAETMGRKAFRELRIAVLDGYARQAYAEGGYALARMLWREAYAMDPQRAALAHNLALCAARMKSMEDYASAWPRSVELRYMEAAAVQDLTFGMEERTRAHKAVASQACAAYMPEERRSEKYPDYLRWAADRVAVKTWLSEWDLYYTNARLAFRSPVHRLGIPRDATPGMQAAAKQSLLTLIAIASRRFPAGARDAAAGLAREAVEEADRLASQNIERVRDRYYLLEAKAAEKLLQECVQRVYHIAELMKAHRKELKSTDIAVTGWLGIRLLALPLDVMAPLLARTSSGLEESEVRGELERIVLATVDKDSRPRRGDEQIREGLEILDLLFRLMPARQEEARGLKRRFGVEMLPEDCQQVTSVAQAERAVQVGLELLRRYPQADGLRWHLADLMTKMGRKELLERAAELSREGKERGLAPEFREVLDNLGEAVEEESRKIDAAAAVSRLLDQAAAAAKSAVSAVNAGGYDAVERAAALLDDAAGKAREAAERAEAAGMEEGVRAARNLEQQIDSLRERISGR